MVGFTNRTARGILDHITGKTAIFALTTPCYLALFTAVGADDGTGFTEVSGGGYARVAMAAADWNAAGGSAPSTVTNASAVVFPTATAGWGTVIAMGLYDASTAGNLLVWDYLGGFPVLPFSCTAASPGVLTVPAHGFSNGQSAVVTAEYGGTLPATGGSWAGIKTVANVTTDTFTLGVNTTGTGNGMVRRVATQDVPSGVAPTFAVNSITLVAA
jgi:hypothetical protein